jgi:fumarate reductase flavoprotein subunit
MKNQSLFLAVMCALLLGVVLGCASAQVAPIGNATGTATATAAGFGGDVTVTITMANGFITDVVAKGDAESSTVGGPALLRLPNSIKKYNTAKVDSISGATITSMAVSAAAQEAIDKIVAGN